MSVVVSSSSGQESSRIAPGAKVRMQCSAQGYPVPQYTWYFRPRGSSSMPRKLAIQDYYEIPSFQATDEGLFSLCDSSLFVLYTCCYISVLENCVPIYNPTNDNDHASEYFPNDY